MIHKILNNDIIIEIFKHINTNTKYNMIKVFPWLVEYLPLCDNYCGNKSCFELNFITWNSCCLYNSKGSNKKNIAYKETKYVCDIECDQSRLESDNLKIDDEHFVSVDYTYEDECGQCGQFIMTSVDANGYQVQDVPKPLSIKEKIDLFIIEYLIIDEKSMILKSDIVLKFQHNMDESYTKAKSIKKIFDKLIINNQYYYIGYKFIYKESDNGSEESILKNHLKKT